MEHVRAKITFDTKTDITEFIMEMAKEKDVFVLEDFSGKNRVSAQSMIGVLYAEMNFADDIYIVNETNNGVFPASIDKFRVVD